MKSVTIGLIVGNRGFFPAELCEKGRKIMVEVLEKQGFQVVALGASDTRFGSIESIDEARQCADFFDARRRAIDGVVVTLPNFGDERAVANALRWANLRVPVLIHAFPDAPDTSATPAAASPLLVPDITSAPSGAEVSLPVYSEQTASARR